MSIPVTSRLSPRLLAVAGLVVAIAAGGYLWLGGSGSIQTIAPERDVAVRVFGLGTIEARIVSKVGFEVAAALTELSADHGDSVKKGAVLARLHATEQEAKVAKAKADVLSAEVGIVKAEANVAKTQAVLVQKQEANRRKQSLVDRRVVSEQSAEEALRDEEVAKADVAVARADVEVAKAKLADARAQLAFEQTILEHHVLLAPFDALVVERHKELGGVIKAGDPIFTLVAPETVWALAYIDESRAGAIKLDQPVELRLRSLPQRSFKGKVARIGIESDRVTEERRVYIACEDCPMSFHLGEQVEAFISVAALKEALLVPEASVKGFDGRHASIWTIEDGKLRQRRVAIGLRTEDARLEITSGLPKDAKVAIGVPQQAREGRAVSAAAAKSEAGK